MTIERITRPGGNIVERHRQAESDRAGGASVSRPRGGYAGLPRGLVGRERGVDAVGQGLEGLVAGLDDADAGGDGALEQVGLAIWVRKRSTRILRAVERGAGHDDRKLVAAEAEARVHDARVLGQDRADRAQQLVAGGLAEPVVRGVEAVEVE